MCIRDRADTARDLSEKEETIAKVEEKLGYPVFVKPSNAGSSQGVSLSLIHI